MTTEIIVAIVASVASLAVAIVSLLTALISNRQSLRSTKLIETLRRDLERQRSTEELQDLQMNQSLEALQMAVRAIQRVKDEVQLILSAGDSSLDSAAALARISTAREQLFVCYEDRLADLDEWESSVVHRAKNQALAIENIVRYGLGQAPYVSALPDTDRQRLLELRSQLTDAQQLLRDSRTDKLTQRIGNA